jgi:hypothetical protein
MIGGIPLILFAFVIVMMLRERRTVAAFEMAGALAPGNARTPQHLALRPSSIGWRRLRSHAVVRETSPASGLFYLDEEVWHAVRHTRRRVLAALLLIMVAMVVFGVVVRPQ